MRLAAVAVAALALALASQPLARADFRYDQSSNLTGPANSTLTGADLGQSFVPTATSIAGGFFTLTAAPTATETFVFTLRSGAGLGGPILATTTVVTDSFIYLQYNFAQPIPLTPGLTYTVDVALTTGASFSLLAFNTNPYAAGSAYTAAGAVAGSDLLFAEGPTNAVPEPSSLALLGLGLAGVGACSRRRA